MNFSSKITDWYKLNKRDLPWRNNPEPYKIWLSEIILQQTRVAQGLPYYEKFFAAYPNVKSFANAQISDILLLWQGLGYYSRGRNMHFAANQVMTEFKGIFPNNFKDLKKLKGVGEYTAAAIASIACNESVAVVDGNVYRVLARYFNEAIPIDSTEGKKIFSELANELVPKINPGDHNQGMMELGALICTPKKPDCINCPINSSCQSAFSASVELLPVKSKKVKVKERKFNYFHLKFEDKIIIHKRHGKDIWEGLHQFPLVEGESQEIQNELKKLTGLNQEFGLTKGITLKHILTHQRIFADFFTVDLTTLKGLKSEFIVTTLEDMENFALPKLMVNYIESINKN